MFILPSGKTFSNEFGIVLLSLKHDGINAQKSTDEMLVFNDGYYVTYKEDSE